MGTSGTAAELAGKLNDAANRIGLAESKARALRAAGIQAKDIYEQHAQQAGLRVGAQLAGKPWGGFRVKEQPGQVVVSPGGPVHLHNAPTRPHWILPKGARGNLTAAGPVLPGMAAPVVAQAGRKRRTAGAEALTIGANPRANAMHPGTRGKGWGSAAKRRIEVSAPETFQRELSSVWSAVFR
jgi:hypothetical protein